MIIEKVSNGYIVSSEAGKWVTPVLEQVLDYVLLHFEGRSPWFGGDKFGKVIILREPTDEYPEVEPA